MFTAFRLLAVVFLFVVSRLHAMPDDRFRCVFFFNVVIRLTRWNDVFHSPFFLHICCWLVVYFTRDRLGKEKDKTNRQFPVTLLLEQTDERSSFYCLLLHWISERRRRRKEIFPWWIEGGEGLYRAREREIWSHQNKDWLTQEHLFKFTIHIIRFRFGHWTCRAGCWSTSWRTEKLK